MSGREGAIRYFTSCKKRTLFYYGEGGQKGGGDTFEGEKEASSFIEEERAWPGAAFGGGSVLGGGGQEVRSANEKTSHRLGRIRSGGMGYVLVKKKDRGGRVRLKATAESTRKKSSCSCGKKGKALCSLSSEKRKGGGNVWEKGRSISEPTLKRVLPSNIAAAGKRTPATIDGGGRKKPGPGKRGGGVPGVKRRESLLLFERKKATITVTLPPHARERNPSLLRCGHKHP